MVLNHNEVTLEKYIELEFKKRDHPKHFSSVSLI